MDERALQEFESVFEAAALPSVSIHPIEWTRILVAIDGSDRGSSAGAVALHLAKRVDCPVLFLVQWDDELVERGSALELFGALGAKDKRLHSHPGVHTAVPPEEFDASEAFLARHLETGPSAA